MEKSEKVLPNTPGGRLRLLRKEQNLSQEKLAEAIKDLGGCCAKQIGYIENDRPGRELKYDLADIFAQFFSVDVAFLMCKSNYRTQRDKNRAVLSHAQNEADLLYAGLWAFAELTGYAIHNNMPDAIKLERLDHDSIDIDVEPINNLLQNAWTISHNGAIVHLSVDQMCRFQNEVCDFVELKLKHLFAEKGENNG